MQWGGREGEVTHSLVISRHSGGGGRFFLGGGGGSVISRLSLLGGEIENLER